MIDLYQTTILKMMKNKRFSNFSEMEKNLFLLSGLSEEVGEVCQLFKKSLLKTGRLLYSKQDLTEELGDVLWHVVAIGIHNNIDFMKIINMSQIKTFIRNEKEE